VIGVRLQPARMPLLAPTFVSGTVTSYHFAEEWLPLAWQHPQRLSSSCGLTERWPSAGIPLDGTGSLLPVSQSHLWKHLYL